MSKYKNPIRKYIIDGVLAIGFVCSWAYLSQVEWDSQQSAMSVAAFLMLAYVTAIRVNKNEHEQ